MSDRSVMQKKSNRNENDEFNSNIQKLESDLYLLEDSQFKRIKITQNYSKNEFIADVFEQIRHLPENESQKVFEYFGFKLEENDRASYKTSEKKGYSLVGYPKNENREVINGLEQVIENVRKYKVKFSENNRIKIEGYRNLEEKINKIIEELPQLRVSIGNIQHKKLVRQKDGRIIVKGHLYDVFTHSMKVAQGIVRDKKFSNLNKSDKKIMILAALLHDISKKEGYVDDTHAKISSIHANFITKNLGLEKEEEKKLYTLIRNHEWLKEVNSSKNREELEERIKSTAKELKEGNLFEIAMIFTQSDLKGVNEDFADEIYDENGEILESRRDFNKEVRSFAQAAEYYANDICIMNSKGIRGYIEKLKKNK